MRSSQRTAFRSTTALSLLVAAGLMVLPLSSALAQEGGSATAGMDQDSQSLPAGRLPSREPEALKPIPPLPFKLTAPSVPELRDEGVFKPNIFTLSNGLAVVVLTNKRAPIVSHMVWYRVGAADEPQGKSGLAHLLEHLMFKGTATVPDGAFSRTVAANGGQDNAFTSWDFTAYFQNIAKDRLEMMMQMEADRMSGLTLEPSQVKKEIEVVLAERQQRSENTPLDRLREAMSAVLFVHHPYGRPVIGWESEIKALTREDALAFYRTWYSPSNAILVVSGDITVDELKPMAERTYGKVAARPVPARNRVVEPQLDAERRVSLKDANITQPIFMRLYKAPSFNTAKPEEVAALDVMAEILGGGPTSRLYRRLAMDLRVATNVRFDYDATAHDLATASAIITPVEGYDLTLIEQSYDALVRDLVSNGVSEAELNRAKMRLVNSAIFARDSVQAPAYVFGMTLASGGDVSDVEKWPQRIMAVTAEQVQVAAKGLFGQAGAVTGLLLPDKGGNK